MRAGKLARAGGVMAVCAALGAGGAYVGGAASSPASSSAKAKTAQGAGKNGKRRGPLRALRRAVHVDAVVPVKGGTFATVTLDRGVVQSVSGSQLTLKEGTKQATYKTVTLDIPSGAVVRINRKPGQLSDVKAGQRAMVLKGAKRTAVIVRDAGAGKRAG